VARAIHIDQAIRESYYSLRSLIGPEAALNACPVSNVLSEVSIGPWRIRDDQLPPFDRREVRPI